MNQSSRDAGSSRHTGSSENNGLSNDLNAPSRDARLAALRREMASPDTPIRTAELTDEVNNHVHTIYSFSPYSPTMAAALARIAGLRAVGSVDHDSISAAAETIEACKVIGMGSTVGCELRVNFTGTRLEGRKINNPDSENLAYMVLHGVPLARVPEVAAFLEPVQRSRNSRNVAQVARLNDVLAARGLETISFDSEVAARSCVSEGGTITERHILFALSTRLLALAAPGKGLLDLLSERLDVEVPPRVRPVLADPDNPHIVYDLLGVLKSSFLERIFIHPGENESLPVETVVSFGNRVGAIPAYAYLGDVAESPTGDKKAEKFEDSYLDELFEELAEIGFRSVTYMPPRNTVEQLRRVKALAEHYGLMEISGVDINSSRQSFRCPEILTPDFRHLIDTTWALIAHEKLSACDASYGIFHPSNPLAAIPLPERIRRYSAYGKAIDHHHPENIRRQEVNL